MRRLTGREKRLLILFAMFVAIAAWAYAPRPWSPKILVETEHYAIRSSATEDQTREIGLVAEIVYSGYLRLMGELQRTVQPHPKLGIKLFKDRREFRRCNRVHGWAEAFYRPPYSYQYYSAGESHPYHWRMHEATHQFNDASARRRLAQWLEEGLACYVSTSRIVDNTLHLGEIDTNTYPVWWLDSMELSGDLDADKKNGTVIPLRAIISGQGGPSMNWRFNLYYLHWWSLTHFLMHYENNKYKEDLSRLIAEGADWPPSRNTSAPSRTSRGSGMVTSPNFKSAPAEAHRR